ncbi:MAG: prepilin-type N-terminal cleavage/methylation domain-containing protein [Alphaproteobacteria bacterium]|nr:prepilin-type N-terminal cleavage/methylation domain-containing protein [Alphaproteobacteria bacterium]
MKKARRGKKGFTLVELAVVLGVVGLVLGGIWVFAGRSNESARTEQSLGQLVILLNNIRSYYLSQPNMASGDVTTILAAASVFPSEMLRAGAPTIVDHPWGALPPGGGLLVSGTTASGGASTGGTYYFTLTYRGLKAESCIAFAARAGSGPTANGLTAVSVSGTPISMPPLIGALGGPCAVDGGTGTGANVALTYRLRLQN